ncbi:alginate O-acetyltransferase [Aquipseudomonas ullengensis]|uniref:Probable alginate O-acetylase AlgJ n=1 Tax=Aquipseudomonas ullengensis TaxID=2759166 RepID=A0A7W4LM29_9GAMM|nr:alginate O-acetyltransferase [Pseudomonas ullengensis]MBB2495635.1 alginate O-acetyltransferase [Pseudomonas ullengensis]
MTRTANLLYIGAFAGSLLALAISSARSFGDFSVATDTPVLNGKLSHAFEKHYDAEFPVKQFGTNVWAALDFTLFGEGRPGVVIGQDGWLYSDEEFKPVADGKQHLRDNLAMIRGVRDELASQGIQLVLAIVPAKSRLYPEYVGENRITLMRQDLFEQFRGSVRRAGIIAPDLLGPLQEAKHHGQVFLRTDTHWTPLGADVAAQRLSAAVQRAVTLQGEPQDFVTEDSHSESYKGDLTRFLPLDPLFEQLMPAPDNLQQRRTTAANSSTAADDAALFSDSALPVTLVGTSYSANPSWNFAGALREYLQRDLSNHAEDGHGPILPMLKYLQSDELKSAKPQVVIWEFPERYLPMANDLSEFDPDWIAELKNSANTRLTDTASR